MIRSTAKLDYDGHQLEKPKLDMDRVVNGGCIVVIVIAIAAIVLSVIVLWREGVVPVQH